MPDDTHIIQHITVAMVLILLGLGIAGVAVLILAGWKWVRKG
jgi:hypothetical protein